MNNTREASVFVFNQHGYQTKKPSLRYNFGLVSNVFLSRHRMWGRFGVATAPGHAAWTPAVGHQAIQTAGNEC